MSEQIFINLFHKNLDGHLAADEQRLFQSFLSEEHYQALFNRLMEEVMTEDHTGFAPDAVFDEQAIFNRVMEQESSQPAAVIVSMEERNRRRRRWFTAVAAILVVVSAGAYLWQAGTTRKPVLYGAAQVEKAIPPGKEGAILTLADGSSIVLDSAGDGIIASMQGSNVLLHQGQLSYSETGVNGVAEQNTLTTPRGRQFSVVLPDGTKVWLNAASSLTYPSRFTGEARLVQVTGEAYFEVAKDARRPFKVQVQGGADDAAIEVLGTSFNINAYKDEPVVKATLLDGSIRVVQDIKNRNNNKILQPGQQAVISNAALTVKEVETEEVVAWKNGYFHFRDAGIKEVMRALQRWYDIEIVYEGKVSDRSFQGKIQKDLTLSELLSGLQRSDVHFKTDQKTLTILP
jgi:ferric-dicitrate binding protein FerR (iron transport regulator)